MAQDFRLVADRLDALVRSGRAGEARSELEGIVPGRVSRVAAPTLAWVAARAGLPELGLRMLAPFVRPTDGSAVRPSADEAAQYAFCLAWIGANEEALELLKELGPSGNPRVLFSDAVARIGRWDYRGAIPALERYVRSVEVTTYERLVGRANLASCLAYERRFAEAEPLIAVAGEEARAGGHRLLVGNLRLLAAYGKLMQRQWEAARGILDEAWDDVRDSGTLDGLFVRKWRAVGALKERFGPESLAALEDVRREAVERAHWETVRDCDRFRAVCEGDETRLWSVWFGTPYASFREKLIEDFPRPLTAPEAWEWPAGSGELVLDVRGGALADGRRLPLGGTLHRLLQRLASDLYHPLRVASIFAGVFPGEHYQPDSSPPRVHQAIKLLRRWLDEESVPLTVEEANGFYRLAWRGGCRLRLTPVRDVESRESNRWSRLREHAGRAEFSMAECMAWLGVSRRTAQRLLEAAIAEGVLSRRGLSTATRYRFS